MDLAETVQKREITLAIQIIENIEELSIDDEIKEDLISC
jgi:hypothetical protein